MDYGKRLKDLRSERKLSANALAKQVDLDPTTIYKIESGASKPSMDALERICGVFGITMAEFFADNTDALNEFKMKKYPRDFVKMIQQEDFTLNGELASPEDKERMIQIYYLMWQDSKDKNKKARAEAKARKEQ